MKFNTNKKIITSVLKVSYSFPSIPACSNELTVILVIISISIVKTDVTLNVSPQKMKNTKAQQETCNFN